MRDSEPQTGRIIEKESFYVVKEKNGGYHAYLSGSNGEVTFNDQGALDGWSSEMDAAIVSEIWTAITEYLASEKVVISTPQVPIVQADVEIPNSLSETIYATDGISRYDTASKRLLSEKIILAYIMKIFMEEYRDCTISDIAQKYIEGDVDVSGQTVHPNTSPTIVGSDTADKVLKEGTTYYDIKYKAITPESGESVRLYVNVEPQSKTKPGYPVVKRGVYYCCRMISSQHNTEFTASDYGNIKKVYSIWICTDPPQYLRNTAQVYQMSGTSLVGDAIEPRENYDLLVIIVIYLDPNTPPNVTGGSTQYAYEDGIRLLSALLSVELNEVDTKRILLEEFGIPLTDKLKNEVSDMKSLGQGLLEKGEAKGKAEGLVEGKIKGLMEAARNMKAAGLTLEQIVQYTGLSLQEIEQL